MAQQVVEREVIREPAPARSGNNSVLIAVLIIALLLVFAYVFFGGGRRLFSGFGGTTIAVPDQIDVNVNSGGNGGGAPAQGGQAAPQAPSQ